MQFWEINVPLIIYILNCYFSSIHRIAYILWWSFLKLRLFLVSFLLEVNFPTELSNWIRLHSSSPPFHNFIFHYITSFPSFIFLKVVISSCLVFLMSSKKRFLFSIYSIFIVFSNPRHDFSYYRQPKSFHFFSFLFAFTGW